MTATVGTVFIGDFDLGVVLRVGGELVDYTVDGGTRQEYAINMTGVTGPSEYGGHVPIFFVAGRVPFSPRIFPCVVIRRQDPELAMQNGGQSWGVEDRIPSDGASEVTIEFPDGSEETGYDSYDSKQPAPPYNLRYEIILHARGGRAQQDSNLMLKHMMEIFTPPGGLIYVTDSIDDERSYDAFIESMNQTTEVLDLTARDVGWTLTLLIHGELDVRAVTSEVSVYQLPTVDTAKMDELEE